MSHSLCVSRSTQTTVSTQRRGWGLHFKEQGRACSREMGKGSSGLFLIIFYVKEPSSFPFWSPRFGIIYILLHTQTSAECKIKLAVNELSILWECCWKDLIIHPFCFEELNLLLKGDLKLECDELWQVNFKLCAILISNFWKIFAV